MELVFTICANNYLAQAKVLGQSLKQHAPGTPFLIFLCDEKRPEINYDELADEVIPVAEIEPAMRELALRYSIVELSTCVKPRVFEYLLHDRKAARVIYLDPDIKVYQPVSWLYEELATASIILTPHVYTPVPFDNKTPGENTFLNYGLYNLGFIGVSNDAEVQRFISWWKEHTYKEGYIAPERGIFVDQLPINHAPIFFSNVRILQDTGANMAPWNLHERYLTLQDGRYVVNGAMALKFYHFSSFRVDANELPLHQYDRFTLSDRPDLHRIYQEYNEDMKAAGHSFYQQFECIYSVMREAHLIELELQKPVQEKKPVHRLLRKLFS